MDPPSLTARTLAVASGQPCGVAPLACELERHSIGIRSGAFEPKDAAPVCSRSRGSDERQSDAKGGVREPLQPDPSNRACWRVQLDERRRVLARAEVAGECGFRDLDLGPATRLVPQLQVENIGGSRHGLRWPCRPPSPPGRGGRATCRSRRREPVHHRYRIGRSPTGVAIGCPLGIRGEFRAELAQEVGVSSPHVLRGERRVRIRPEETIQQRSVWPASFERHVGLDVAVEATRAQIAGSDEDPPPVSPLQRVDLGVKHHRRDSRSNDVERASRELVEVRQRLDRRSAEVDTDEALKAGARSVREPLKRLIDEVKPRPANERHRASEPRVRGIEQPSVELVCDRIHPDGLRPRLDGHDVFRFPHPGIVGGGQP